MLVADRIFQAAPTGYARQLHTIKISGTQRLKHIELDSAVEQLSLKRQSKIGNPCNHWRKFNKMGIIVAENQN